MGLVHLHGLLQDGLGQDGRLELLPLENLQDLFDPLAPLPRVVQLGQEVLEVLAAVQSKLVSIQLERLLDLLL